MIPERPPRTKKTMKPTIQSSGVLNAGRPLANVVSQAKIWIELGITTIIDAAAQQIVVTVERPAETIGGAHTPKAMNATRISAIATSGNATIRRLVNVGMIDVAI